MEWSNIKVSCDAANLKKIRAEVGQLLDTHQIKGEMRDQIVLAVDEACANAIIHGNHSDPGKEISLRVAEEGNTLLFTLYGVGEFHPEENEDRKLEYLVKNRQKGGLGLKLMYAVMDKVEFFEEKGQYICKMTKQIRP